MTGIQWLAFSKWYLLLLLVSCIAFPIMLPLLILYFRNQSLQVFSGDQKFQMCCLHTNKHIKVKVLVTQSCPTLCDPVDCSLPGSSVLRILQARILEWVAMPSSRIFVYIFIFLFDNLLKLSVLFYSLKNKDNNASLVGLL